MDLPEPVHGMSNVNFAVKASIEGRGVKPLVINTAPSYASCFFNTRFWPFIKFFHSFFCVLRLFVVFCGSRSKVLYRPINGGKGQIYDLAYLLVARLFASRIYIHHHSFDYLNSPTMLFRFLVILAGAGAEHIVLGEAMKKKLIDIYTINPSLVKVVSNLAYFESRAEAALSHSNKLVIGHLANLCLEKGLRTFIEVCRDLELAGVEFHARLAGPLTSPCARAIVEGALRELDNLEYIGPVYGEQKSKFYRELDVFVFPSSYKNEAEPLVLYEAAQYGVYVCGTKRGCMEDVINKLGGDSFIDDELLVPRLTKKISGFYENNFHRSPKQFYRSLFDTEREKALVALNNLFEELVSYELPKAK